MWYTFYIASLSFCALIYLIFEHLKTKQRHDLIIQRDGCRPPKIIPNKLWPPFGLDKLALVTKAEKTKSYPLLMLNEHEDKGDTYGQFGGPVFTVITRDIDNIREILSRQQKNFDIGSGRAGCVAPLLGDGIFVQDGAKWEHSRKMLAPLIQRPTLPDLKLIERHSQRLLKRIPSNANSFLDLKPILFDLSLEITTEFLLGDPSDLIDQGAEARSVWGDSFATEFNTAFGWISKRERLKLFYWMVDSREFRRSCKNSRTIVENVIDRSMEALRHHHKAEESYVAMEPLFRDQLDAQVIRDQFLNLLLAGRDTSGSLLCWVFYALAREPEIVATLRQEIGDIVGLEKDSRPTKSDLNRMVMLDRFLTETLRVFPPVPINGRFSNTDTSIPRGGGSDGQSPMLIPKGTLIAFSTFAVQHDKKLYGADASKFRTDRWSDEMIKERRMIDWSYHPFIGGPRKCLGERFALVQAKYLIIRVLQHFDSITPVNAQGDVQKIAPNGSWVDNVKYHVGLTMSPDDGVWVKLKASVG